MSDEPKKERDFTSRSRTFCFRGFEVITVHQGAERISLRLGNLEDAAFLATHVDDVIKCLQDAKAIVEKWRAEFPDTEEDIPF